tara:strand:+ start:12053 stop:12283 length:231 start_codon:yes stop_codon:yes gene_type:complete
MLFGLFKKKAPPITREVYGEIVDLDSRGTFVVRVYCKKTGDVLAEEKGNEYDPRARKKRTAKLLGKLTSQHSILPE